MSYESEVYADVLLELSREGHRVFRNHNGMGYHKNGNPVRFGLGPGTSDLIGMSNDGRFLAIELKKLGWKPTPAWERGKQKQFIDFVLNMGGRAGVATTAHEALAIASMPLRKEAQ